MGAFVHELIAVSCFFACRHVERAASPEAAHILMERHYAEAHRAELDRIIERYRYA